MGMTMPDRFSRDNPGPRPRFRPGPGQLGEHAALQVGRPSRQATPTPRRTRQRDVPRANGLGLPAPPEQKVDDGHLLYGLRHLNSVGLGRDLPFGLWALHNGHFPELAKGQQPFDWLD